MKARTVVFNGIIELDGTIPTFITAGGKTMFNSAPTDSGLDFPGELVDSPIYPVWDSSPPQILSLSDGHLLSGAVTGVAGNPSFAYLPVNVKPMYTNGQDH